MLFLHGSERLDRASFLRELDKIREFTSRTDNQLEILRGNTVSGSAQAPSPSLKGGGLDHEMVCQQTVHRLVACVLYYGVVKCWLGIRRCGRAGERKIRERLEEKGWRKKKGKYSNRTTDGVFLLYTSNYRAAPDKAQPHFPPHGTGPCRHIELAVQRCGELPEGASEGLRRAQKTPRSSVWPEVRREREREREKAAG